MNNTFTFYAQPPPTYQPLPSAPPYVTVPVNLPVAVALPEESDEQKYNARRKVVAVLACWGGMFVALYLFIYWANHVTAS